VNTYKLTHEGYVIKNGTDKVPTTDTPDFPNANPDYLEYCQWLKDGFEPEPADPLPQVVPHSVTRAQAIAALILTGKRAQVQLVIDSIPDPVQRELAQNDWDNRLTFERDNPRLVAIAAALSIDLDEMFILAGQQ
jgi:hypothetical protein